MTVSKYFATKPCNCENLNNSTIRQEFDVFTVLEIKQSGNLHRPNAKKGNIREIFEKIRGFCERFMSFDGRDLERRKALREAFHIRLSVT